MTEPQIDPKKVRIGSAFIAVVVLAAIVLFFVVNDPLGRAVMFAIAVLGIVRVALLARQLRRGA